LENGFSLGPFHHKFPISEERALLVHGHRPTCAFEVAFIGWEIGGKRAILQELDVIHIGTSEHDEISVVFTVLGENSMRSFTFLSQTHCDK